MRFNESSVSFSFQEVYPVQALSCHPGGEFLLVATTHPTIRLYNIETAQSYASANPSDQHLDSVTDVGIDAITQNFNIFIGTLFGKCKAVRNRFK